jgi:hypothetical protein
MIYSKISDERVVLMEAWRTHERQRVGGSQRSEGHGYLSAPHLFTSASGLVAIKGVSQVSNSAERTIQVKISYG